MVIGDLIDSNIMQLIPIEFGKSMVEKLMGSSHNTNELTMEEQTPVQSMNYAEDHIEVLNKINKSRIL